MNLELLGSGPDIAPVLVRAGFPPVGSQQEGGLRTHLPVVVTCAVLWRVPHWRSPTVVRLACPCSLASPGRRGDGYRHSSVHGLRLNTRLSCALRGVSRSVSVCGCGWMRRGGPPFNTPSPVISLEFKEMPFEVGVRRAIAGGAAVQPETLAYRHRAADFSLKKQSFHVRELCCGFQVLRHNGNRL